MEKSTLSKEELMNIELFLVQEWESKLNEDGIFDFEDNTDTWIIDEKNAQEFIEALGLDQIINLNDLNKIVQDKL